MSDELTHTMNEATVCRFFEVWEPNAKYPLAITSMWAVASDLAEVGDEIRVVEWARIREVPQ